jgi:hypothetical protein
MKTILALLAAMTFVWATKLDLTALTAVIALAAIGCCGLLYDISILLSRIHDDMPGPVRERQRSTPAGLLRDRARLERATICPAGRAPCEPQLGHRTISHDEFSPDSAASLFYFPAKHQEENL